MRRFLIFLGIVMFIMMLFKGYVADSAGIRTGYIMVWLNRSYQSFPLWAIYLFIGLLMFVSGYVGWKFCEWEHDK